MPQIPVHAHDPVRGHGMGDRLGDRAELPGGDHTRARHVQTDTVPRRRGPDHGGGNPRVGLSHAGDGRGLAGLIDRSRQSRLGQGPVIAVGIHVPIPGARALKDPARPALLAYRPVHGRRRRQRPGQGGVVTGLGQLPVQPTDTTPPTPYFNYLGHSVAQIVQPR